MRFFTRFRNLCQSLSFVSDSTEKEIFHNGNLTMKDVLECARIMRYRSNARLFSGTVLELLGTCVSIGCTVDGQDPKDIQNKINSGEIVVNQPQSDQT